MQAWRVGWAMSNQDKPAPTDFTGVEVTISVIDANSNYRIIGTTTTDINGFYSLQWTPDIPGKYTVIATFAGTDGYWPSKAVAAFAVDEVATPTPVPTQTPSAADLLHPSSYSASNPHRGYRFSGNLDD